MTAPTTPALDRLREAIDRQTRGLTHDGSAEATASWHVRVRYDDLTEALTQASAAKVPEGWKLVPIEPTKGMLQASHEQPIVRSFARSIWSAMLAATPSETANG